MDVIISPDNLFKPVIVVSLPISVNSWGTFIYIIRFRSIGREISWEMLHNAFLPYRRDLGRVISFYHVHINVCGVTCGTAAAILTPWGKSSSKQGINAIRLEEYRGPDDNLANAMNLQYHPLHFHTSSYMRKQCVYCLSYPTSKLLLAAKDIINTGLCFYFILGILLHFY